MKSLFRTLIVSSVLSFSLIMAAPASDPLRIGIIPLSCPSCSEQLQAFALGTQDNLIDGLARVPDLVVVDRTRVGEVIKELAFQESAYTQADSAVKVGEMLGVEYLYTGSLQQSGNEIRILVQQLKVESGESKPLGKVTGSLDKLFALQDQLVDQILGAHGVKLDPAQQQAMMAQIQLTAQPAAYEAYVQALNQQDSESPDNQQMALKTLDRAIALDANFAAAYRQRALLHLRRKDFARARADLEMALKLNPNDGQLLYARGRMRLEQGQIDAAIADLNQAVRLQPAFAPAWNSRGMAKMALKQPEMARADFDQALRLEPAFYHALLNRADLARQSQDYASAIADLERARKLRPRRPAAAAARGDLFQAQGNCREAMRSWEEACRLGLRKLCRQRCQTPGQRQFRDKSPR